MRTTLTLDDDLAGVLQRQSRDLGKPFKEVINAALRKGLACDSAELSGAPPRVRPRPLGLKSGIDPNRMNQLIDEMETEEVLRKLSTQ
jgi:hypothetical protein